MREHQAPTAADALDDFLWHTLLNVFDLQKLWFCCRTRSSRWNFEDLNTFTESLWLLFIELWFCRLGHWNLFLLVNTYLSEQKYYLQMQGKTISSQLTG